MPGGAQAQFSRDYAFQAGVGHGPVGGVNGTELPDDRVAGEFLGVLRDVAGQVGAADLLLALDQELDLKREFTVAFPVKTQGCQAGDYLALVICRAAAVEVVAAPGEGPRVGRPGVQRLGRLHVVVVVEQDRGAVGVTALAVNDGCPARLVQFGADAFGFQQFTQLRGGLGDAAPFSRQAGYGHQPGGLFEHEVKYAGRDLRLVVAAHRLSAQLEAVDADQFVTARLPVSQAGRDAVQVDRLVQVDRRWGVRQDLHRFGVRFGTDFTVEGAAGERHEFIEPFVGVVAEQLVGDGQVPEHVIRVVRSVAPADQVGVGCVAAEQCADVGAVLAHFDVRVDADVLQLCRYGLGDLHVVDVAAVGRADGDGQVGGAGFGQQFTSPLRIEREALDRVGVTEVRFGQQRGGRHPGAREDALDDRVDVDSVVHGLTYARVGQRAALEGVDADVDDPGGLDGPQVDAAGAVQQRRKAGGHVDDQVSLAGAQAGGA